MKKKSSTGYLGGGGTKVRGKYVEFIRYLEDEAKYLENIDPQRYRDMIQKRRAEAKKTRNKLQRKEK